VSFDEFRKWAELASFCAQILGIPGAILAYWFTRKHDREEREREAYGVANDKYLEYLKLCLEHPSVDAFEVLEADANDDKAKTRTIIFAVLISAMESAFLHYHGASDQVRAKQWKGWDSYIAAWLRDPRFEHVWAELGIQYDDDFVKHVNTLRAAIRAEKLTQPKPELPAK
jgi:hypothetical protein